MWKIGKRMSFRDSVAECRLRSCHQPSSTLFFTLFPLGLSKNILLCAAEAHCKRIPPDDDGHTGILNRGDRYDIVMSLNQVWPDVKTTIWVFSLAETELVCPASLLLIGFPCLISPKRRDMRWNDSRTTLISSLRSKFFFSYPFFDKVFVF